MIRRILISTVLMLALLVSSAAAHVYREEFVLPEEKTCDWRTLGQKEPALLPVYSAPFPTAWRGGGGRAAVSTKEPFLLLGMLQGGTWGMVEYSVDGENRRIGWIEIPEGTKTLPRDDTVMVSRKPMTVLRNTFATDDPRGGRRVLWNVPAGTRVIGMYQTNNYEWVYAETEHEGQTAWVYLPLEDVEENGPLYRMQGDTLVIAEGVTVLGDANKYVTDDEEDEWASSRMELRVEPGDIFLGGFYMYESPEDTELYHLAFMDDDTVNGSDDEGDDAEANGPTDSTGEDREVYTDDPPTDDTGNDTEEETDDLPEGYGGFERAFRRVVLPDSLRRLGPEALIEGVLEEMRMPVGLRETHTDAFYHVWVKRVIIPAGAVGDFPNLSTGEWQVESGNPRYKDVDGVLFSADGTRLLRYPTHRSQAHYDVPAGTREIGDFAFYEEDMDLELQSISLPIGLEKIGAYAFSGCGWLRSLTVPLTVKELDKTAFHNCVSLERLSLPPNLTAEIGNWAEPADFTWFNGDNGSTLAAPKPQ